MLPDMRWSLIAALVTMVAIVIHKKKTQVNKSEGRKSIIIGYSLFCIWLLVQYSWALDPTTHSELIALYIKYAMLIWLITTTIDSEKHLHWFLWAHILGCTYLGWVADTEYDGGRFESFGGSDINEANAGALQMVSALFIGASIFLTAKLKEKVLITLCMPFVANALILTSSRSAFLAAAVGGLTFNLCTQKNHRWLIRALSILAVLGFFALTNQAFWDRMNTLKAVGEQVEGVDTGSSRLVIAKAQLDMFKSHPFGCGHRCTAVLSPQYLDDKYLTGTKDNRGRSSHNTVLSLLVEQGIFGIAFYLMYFYWMSAMAIKLLKSSKNKTGLIGNITPGLVGMIAAIMIGDMFVDYLKSEIRIWLASLLIVCLHLANKNNNPNQNPKARDKVPAIS